MKFGKLREIKFLVEMLPPVLNGEKTLTIRKDRGWIHNLKQHEVFLGYFSPGESEKMSCVLLLQATENVERVPFSKLSKDLAREDGYPSPKTLIRMFKKQYYPDLKPEDTAVVIRFRVLERPTGDFLWKPTE